MTTEERQLYWEEQVKRWQASGMTIRDWSREQGLSEKTVSSWKRKLLNGKQRRNQVPAGWHEVKQKPPVKTAVSGMKLEINEHVKIELGQGFDPKLLRDVVDALTKC